MTDAHSFTWHGTGQNLLEAKLPPHRLRRRLAQAVARGARVRLLLAGKSDVRLMQLASRSLYRRLVQKGIELWDYQP
jgi:cardiolipin synthase